MQINLKSFVDQAMSAKESHALYVNEHGVHDTGKVGTAFTRSETFRKTTKEFLNAFTAEYGDKIGDLATKLLHENLEAGKPLTAATVRQIVDFGNAQKNLKLDYLRNQDQKLSRAGNDLDGIILSTDKAEDFLQLLSGDTRRTFTDKQVQLFQEAVNHTRPALLAGAHLVQGNFLENLAQRVREGRTPFLSKAADILLLNPQAPEANLATDNVQSTIQSPAYAPDLSQLQWDNAWTDERLKVAEDKLHLLMMIEPERTDQVDQDMLNRACAALPQLRAAHPQHDSTDQQTFDPHTPMIGQPLRPQTEFTQAELFNAIFPPESTPSMQRPTDDELNRYSPAEMKSCLQEARRHFFDHVKAADLPQGSPFRGSDTSWEQGLAQAKNLGISPQTIMSLTGNHVTLKDIPQLQAINRIHISPLTDDALEADLRQTLSHNGTQGPTRTQTPPTITFASPQNTPITCNLGPKNAASDTQFNDIAQHIKDIAPNQPQAELLMKTLGSEGKIPLLQIMTAFRDGTGISERDPFNYLVQRQDNNDLTVTISTDDSLKPFFGKATLTYTISHLETVEISDFQWDGPTLDARKQALLTDQDCTSSIPALLHETARTANLSEAAAKSFTELAALFLNPIIEQAKSMEDLPSATALKALLPPHEHAMPELKALLALVQTTAFQQTNDSGKAQLLDTVLGTLKHLTSQVHDPISQNAEDLFLDFGLNLLFKTIDLRATQGQTTGPQDMDAMLEPQAPLQQLLTAVLDNLQNPNCYLRARLLPPEERSGFLQATALFQTRDNAPFMNLCMDHSQALASLAQQNQMMTRENVWNVLFQNQLPHTIPTGSAPLQTQNADGTIFNQLSENLMKQAQQARQPQHRDLGLTVTNAYTMLDGGLSPKLVNRFLRGERLPDRIDQQMMQPYAGLCTSRDQFQTYEAVIQLDRDLPRTFGLTVEQPDGTLLNRIPSTLSLNLPAHDGKAPVTVQFNPQKPPLEWQPELPEVNPNSETTTTTPTRTTAQKLANLLLDFCGEGHQEQVASVLLAMSQAGRAPENIKLLFGDYPNRNVPLDLTVNADQEGNIHVKRTSIPGASLSCGWDIIVSPDGTQHLEDFHMERATH